MTRINVVPVKELCNQHMFAEWREIPRLISSMKKSMSRKTKPFTMDEIPSEYVLGKGHVKFFYDKLLYIITRHKELTRCLVEERGFNLKNTSKLTFDVDKKFFNCYNPSKEALELNRKRILKRMPKKPIWIRG